jgi:hypothetical protein
MIAIQYHFAVRYASGVLLDRTITAGRANKIAALHPGAIVKREEFTKGGSL